LKYFIDRICGYIKDNWIIFFFVNIVFVLGLLSGCSVLKSASEEKILNLSKEMDVYFSLAGIQPVDKSEIFFKYVVNNLKIIILTCVSGYFVFLIPVAFIQVFLKGLRVGFFVSFLSQTYSLKGILVSASELIIGNFLFLPFLILYSVFCIRRSMEFYKLKNKKRTGIRKKLYLKSITLTVLMSLIVTLSGFLNGFVLPAILKLITSAF